MWLTLAAIRTKMTMTMIDGLRDRDGGGNNAHDHEDGRVSKPR